MSSCARCLFSNRMHVQHGHLRRQHVRMQSQTGPLGGTAGWSSMLTKASARAAAGAHLRSAISSTSVRSSAACVPRKSWMFAHADAGGAQALLRHASVLCMQSKSRAAESVNVVASGAHTGAPAARSRLQYFDSHLMLVPPCAARCWLHSFGQACHQGAEAMAKQPERMQVRAGVH